MEDRYLQQLKKGVLEMLVLEMVCDAPTYGYELILRLKEKSNGFFSLKEGTLYPILYRLEDDGMIESKWLQGEGRSTPKKIYCVTDKGRQSRMERHDTWTAFVGSVNRFYEEDKNDTGK